MIRNLSHVVIKGQPGCELPKSFFEGRFIPDFHPESLDWEQWWEEQEQRCREGWSDGGFSLDPVHYYHLNFKKINMLNEHKKPTIDHPYFSYEDQEVFNDFRKARNNGKGVLMITGRGFGKSFDVASVCEHEFIFQEASEIIVSASTDFFASELWKKIEIGLSSLPDELKPVLLNQSQKYRENGITETNLLTGKKTNFVYSRMHKVIYDDDSGRTRGTRPNIHVFEEVGSWTGAAKLIDCYNQTEASWWRGKYFTCFPVLIGTGGQMVSGGSEDAKVMFENPESFNLQTFDWNGEELAKFIAAYRKFEGFYEYSGKTDEKAAHQFLIERRERKKKNIKSYQQEVQEFPFEPSEAFMLTGNSWFDVNILYNRYAEIRKTPELKHIIQKGDLKFVKSGNLIIGVDWTQNDEGPFEILEHPEYVDGKVINNLYVSGCDSYDAVEEEATPQDDNKSKGSIFMFKRFYKAGHTGRIFVAKLTQRTPDAEEFYENTVKLNMYYSALMLYEHTKIGIARHYITNKHHRFLYLKPDLTALGVVKSPKAANRYGVTMPIQVKQHIIREYAKYLKDNIENMYFASQILDAMNFNFKSNKHDETMAAALAVLGDEDMYNVQVRQEEKQNIVFPAYRRDANGRLIFA